MSESGAILSDMKVFISSVIVGMEALRDAAARSAEALGNEVRRAEDFGASVGTPQQVCLEGVRWADVVVLLLGSSYGTQQASALSATHEEFREAQGESEILAFVQADVSPEPAQAGLIAEVRDWATGVYTASFSSTDSLATGVTKALHDLELGRASAPEDPAALAADARALVADQGSGIGAPHLLLGIRPSPRREVIRPAEMTTQLAEVIQKEATFGNHRLLDSSAATQARLDRGIRIEQDGAEIVLSPQGEITLRRSLVQGGEYRMAIVEEDVQTTLMTAIGLAAWMLDTVDAPGRLTQAAIAVSIYRAAMGWRTRSEEAASPTSVSIPMTPDPAVISLSIPLARPALRTQCHEIAADLTALCRGAIIG